MSRKKAQKIFFLIAGISLMAVLALTLSSCTPPTDAQNTQNNENASQSEPESSPAPLEITNMGWLLTDDGRVDYSVAVYNPNKDVEALAPVITAKGFDDSGKQIFSESTLISAIAPDTEYQMCFIGNAGGARGIIADLALLVEATEEADGGVWRTFDETSYINSHGDATEIEFATDALEVKDSDIEGTKMFCGTVAIEGNSAAGIKDNGRLDDADAAIPVYVNVVMYDENGAQLGGYFDIVSLPQDGSAVPFEIYAINAPDFKDWKVFVHPFDYAN